MIAELASCTEESKQAAEPEGLKAYTQFYASIVDDLADTRSLLVNDKKTIFVAGDKIQLYVDDGIDNGLFYNLNFQTSSNTFDVDDGYAPIYGSQFYAIYPNGAAFNSSSKKYVVNLEHNFNFRRDMFSATQLMPLWGVSSESNNMLNFSHMAGLIRISLTGSLKVKKITLKGNDGEQIGGAAEVDYKKDKPTLEMAAGYSRFPAAYEQVMTVAETNPYVQLSASPTSFYFVVPPITFSKGITVTVETDDLNHPIVKTTKNALEIGRGVMKSFTSVDTDEILQADAEIQLDALKSLYNSLGGPNWKTKWDTSKPLGDAASWPGITIENGFVTKIDLSNNELSGTIPPEIGTLTSLEDINLSGNNITGGVPKEVNNLTHLKSFYVNNNQMNDSVPYVVYISDVWAYADKKLTQQSGYALKTKYVSSDYSKDGDKKRILTHTDGPGIPVVITCEAFSDDKYDTFVAKAEEAKDYFFSIAPYKDFKNYFDVYRMMAVSPNNEVGLNLVYGTRYNGGSYYIETKKVRKKIEEVMGLKTENLLVIVLLNETETPRLHRAVCFMVSDGFSSAIIPIDDNMEGVIHHEAGGHGFGFLADEYSSDGSRTYGTSEKNDLDKRHNIGWGLNLSYYNTNTTVPWKEFWTDAAYGPENVGAYEGGDGSYKFGVYRSTENSTMNNQYEFDKFNPQSRWIIYKQICERAGLAATLEAFKAYDTKNISTPPTPMSVVTRSNYVEKKNYKLGAPPVIEWKK